jgi:alkylhydroperoxidase family enzyme
VSPPQSRTCHTFGWTEAARHYDELQLGALLVQIATINVWNRLNVPVRQEAGMIPLPER